MAQIGKYCKAYPLRQLREFSGWTEQPVTVEETLSDGTQSVRPREFSEHDHLYLQENFAVTDGIFIDEGVVFSGEADGWLDFCRDRLSFEIPIYETATDAEN